MIIKAETSTLRAGYPGMNRSKIGMIRSLFFTDQSFLFADTDAFENQDEWLDGIKSGNILHLSDIKEVANNSEATEYKKSLQDYQYPGKKGKYIYTFKVIWEKQYQDYIQSISGTDKRVFIADVNNHIHANLYSTQVRGMDVETINIEPKKLPGTTEPAWAIIKLVLSDPDEHNLDTLMDWNPNRINLVHVNITDIDGSGSYLDFTIKDEVFDIPIDYLYIGDMVITDNAGGITPVLLTEKGCGQYRVTGSGALSYGTLAVNSARFYGSGQYFINEETVTLTNFTWESRTKFHIDVRLSGSLDLYTGLILADFDILDDLLGAISIVSVTEVSTGRYEIVVASNLTEGNISVDDGTVIGTAAFDVDIAVTITNIATIGGEETVKVTCDVATVVSGLDVTGLDTTDFSFVDDYNGTIGVSALTETSPGSYELTLDTGRTSGTMYINDIYYSGSAAYSFSTATCINGGASDTTDFINDVGGVAQRFTLQNPSNVTASIVIAPTGFTGNVQQLYQTGGTLPVGIYTRASYFKTGVDYKLRFKLNTNGAGTGSDRYVSVQVYGSDVYVSEQHENISTYFDIIESATFQIDPGEDYVIIQWTYNRVGMYVTIDEIEFIEI